MLFPMAIGSLVGATSLNFCASLPAAKIVWSIASVSLLTISFCLWWTRKQPILKLIWLTLLGAIVGFSWSFVKAHSTLAWQLPRADYNQIITIAGKVEGLTQLYGQTLRFDVVLTDYQNKPFKSGSNPKVRLYWLKPTVNLLDGDKIICEAKLKMPWRLANPGGFDQEKQFFLEGVRATGKLMTLQYHHAKKGVSLARWRQYLNDQMALLLRDKPFLGVIQATSLGIYKNITPEQWQLFQATGTSHAIAISGLHITLIAMFCYKIVEFISRRFLFLTLIAPAKCYGAWAGILFGWLYSAIAGFSIPTQRSLVMIMVAMSATLLRQPILTWQGLAVAWLGIGIVDPLATLQMGFWLSFFCVATLIYSNAHQQNLNRLQKWIMPQWLVFVGIIPLNVLFFHQIPLLSPLANFLALPVINFVVVPASLIGLVLIGISSTLAKWSLYIANEALVWVCWALEKLAASPYNIWQQGDLPFGHSILAFTSVALLLAPKGIPLRHFGWIGLLPMILYKPALLELGSCRFTLLDVGQGLAAIIQTRHHTLLYDAGPRYSETAEAGNRVIIPFLRSQHLAYLDKVIISHSDLDHRAGLASLQHWPIEEILSSEPLRLGRAATQCLAGQSWEWDGVLFQILGPDTLKQKKRNNLSCVLKVSTAHDSVLLTGDIEQSAEQTLLKQYPSLLKSTIVVVPHHGSLTSSSENFVREVAPLYALFPVGLGNRYGFPKQAILDRYQQQGSENLLVSEQGALIFQLNARDNLTPPIRWRDTSRHYWHIQPSGDAR